MRWIVLAFLLCAGIQAALLGPTPYPSFADSPFSGGAFSNFYLENFESGTLLTPGVAASGGVVLSPGAAVDSVDGDDGTIDGSGTGGPSFYVNTSNTLTFTFNAVALGGLLPTHAGIVWTDIGLTTAGPFGVSGVSFTALDQNGISLGSIGPFLLGDGAIAGQSAEDRFFGATNAGGISQIQITMANSLDWEVDHLQYGIAAESSVPEPATWLFTIVGVGGLFLGRRLLFI